MLLSVIITVICLLLVIRRFRSVKASVLEPPELSGKLPFFDHVLLFLTNDYYKLIVKMSEESLEKGGVARTSYIMGIKRGYVITDPEIVKTVSHTSLKKEHLLYSFLEPFLGIGLFTRTSVPAWKQTRKLLNPAFSQHILDSFIGIFNNQSLRLLNKLNLHLGKPFDHAKTIKLNELETIFLTSTGIGGDENSTFREEYTSVILKMVKVFNDRLHRIWYHIDFIYNFSKMKKRQDEVAKQLIDLSDEIIRKKRNDSRTVSGTLEEKQNNILEVIFDIPDEAHSLTDAQIRDEINTMITGGHETIAASLNITLMLLGSHLEVQQKVYNEILQILGESERSINKYDLAKLVYIDAVVKESLRLYPPAPVIARYAKEDIQLKKYTLKANSTCFFFIYGMNRHPVWGPDANQFRPERWLDTEPLPDMNNLGTFSLGRRNCIGKTYSIMSMKISIAHLIRRYRVSADISKVNFKWQMFIYAESGHHFTLERRDDL